MSDPVPSKDRLIDELRAVCRLLPLEIAGRAADEIETARRTADYWKAEHLAGNAEVERLQRELARVTGEREPPHCSTCGCGLAPEPPAVPPHFKLMSTEELCEFLHVAAAFRKFDQNSDAELMEEAARRLAQPPGDGQ